MQNRKTTRIIIIFVAIIATFALIGCGGGAVATVNGGLISPQSYVSEYQDAGASHLLIDVRTPEEFAEGHIEGSININVDEIAYRLDEIPTDQQIIVYCRSGRRSAIAADTLVSNGYQVLDLGGIIDWQGAGFILVR